MVPRLWLHLSVLVTSHAEFASGVKEQTRRQDNGSQQSLSNTSMSPRGMTAARRGGKALSHQLDGRGEEGGEGEEGSPHRTHLSVGFPVALSDRNMSSTLLYCLDSWLNVVALLARHRTSDQCCCAFSQPNSVGSLPDVRPAPCMLSSSLTPPHLPEPCGLRSAPFPGGAPRFTSKKLWFTTVGFWFGVA